MSTMKRQRLQGALYACRRVKKNAAGEFLASWLRLARTPVSAASLRELCKAGCLDLRTDGAGERGKRWYRVVQSTLPFAPT